MKNLIRILFIVCCFFNSAFSFGQEIEWQNTIGGSGEDALKCIHKTSDGGYILGGFSDSNISGDKSENSKGEYDYWIVKTDFLGNIQWQKTIGGSKSDILVDVEQTSDGGYILGGYSNSNISGDKTENCIDTNPPFNDDYWIVKTDAFGNIQWQNTIGGDSTDALTSIQQTSDGGYIIGGSSYSNLSGDKTENCIGKFDYWVVKVDSLGSIEWDNTIGGNDTDGLLSLQQTNDGGYILGGNSNSLPSGDKTESCWNNSIDYWIVKIDATGIIEWQKTMGGDDGELFRSISQTNDNGYICLGLSYSNASGDKTENSRGDIDYWLVKTDSIGNIQWDKTIGGDGYDEPQNVLQNTDGSYILFGFSNSNISGEKTENPVGLGGQYDYWVLKLNNTGTIEWQNTLGGNSSEYASSITKTTDSAYVIAGWTDSNISGDKTENTNGASDFWIVKFAANYNLITGNAYIDLNNNNTEDTGEPDVFNKKITEINSNRFAFTDKNGFYNINILDSSNFSVIPDGIQYYNPTPGNQSGIFTGINQVDSLNDFAYHPTGMFNDLCITITPTSAFHSGFDANYIINYENVGTTTLNGTIKIYPDTVLSYVSSSQLPVSINADSIEWNVGTLTPFQSGTIVVTFNISPLATIGTNCNTLVHIEPIAGDANPSCNFDTSLVIITAAFDPNDILVSEDTLFTTQLSSQPWLYYTICFQNTGNDTAFTVNVLNPIDTNRLELSSIEFVNSSHPVNLNWIPWERNMEFKFNNILLPDSNINEPLSHGFVHYRIKPKTTLFAGVSITNNAYIYFDFNAPVATNTATTRIVLPTGIPNIQSSINNIQLFPNPAKDEITIAGYTLQNNQPAVLKIYDVMGKEVYHAGITTTNKKITITALAKGIYYLHLNNGNQAAVIKVVKF